MEQKVQPTIIDKTKPGCTKGLRGYWYIGHT